MQNKIQELVAQAKAQIDLAISSESLYEVKVKYLGKQGSFSTLLKDLGKSEAEIDSIFDLLQTEVANESKS